MLVPRAPGEPCRGLSKDEGRKCPHHVPTWMFGQVLATWPITNPNRLQTPGTRFEQFLSRPCSMRHAQIVCFCACRCLHWCQCLRYLRLSWLLATVTTQNLAPASAESFRGRLIRRPFFCGWWVIQSVAPNQWPFNDQCRVCFSAPGNIPDH